MTPINTSEFSLDKFDKLLIQVIDEVLRYTLGDLNTSIIYEYLEKRYCPLNDIPNNLEAFSMELKNLLGCGRGQILGSAHILEKTILKVLCARLGLKFDFDGPIAFADCIRKLKEMYSNEKSDTLQAVFS